MTTYTHKNDVMTVTAVVLDADGVTGLGANARRISGDAVAVGDYSVTRTDNSASAVFSPERFNSEFTVSE